MAHSETKSIFGTCRFYGVALSSRMTTLSISGTPRGGRVRSAREPAAPPGHPAATTCELEARERPAATSTRATRPADRTGRKAKDAAAIGPGEELRSPSPAVDG